MKSFGKSLLLLGLSASCLNVYTSCNSQQTKKRTFRTPVVCNDTSKQHFVLDTVKGYEFKPNVNLNLLLDIEEFNSKEEFDKYFMRPPIPADSVPPTLNFKDNWLVGILVDNRTPNPQDLNRWDDVDAKLFVDSAFTKNCQLIIPFYLLANQAPVFGTPAPKRKFVLFSIPRSAQFNEVYVMNTGGSLSRILKVPAAEE